MTGAPLPSLFPRVALVQGASRGIGLELARQLLARGATVIATCRQPSEAHELAALGAAAPELLVLPLDATNETSIAAAAGAAAHRVPRVDWLINVAGVLHDGDLQPEKRIADVTAANLALSFAVNATGPALVARHFESLLLRSARPVFAVLSARVGSIADNRLGGWYSYRASKAALNMLTKTLAIEWARRRPPVACLALHPGTVATELAKPFVAADSPRVFSVERAASQLLELIEQAVPSPAGSFLAWNGETIPW